MRRALRAALACCLAVALVASVAACGDGGTTSDRAAGAPSSATNVVVIMTDDQTLAEMAYLPRTGELLGGGGTRFLNAFAPFPLCCPARATLLTGQYAHNHQVRDNVPPNGPTRFDATNALPVWLQAAGYRTALVGKYFNGYGQQLPAEVPPGWDDWYALLDPGGLNYFGAELLDNGERVTLGADEYVTDALAERAVADIERFSDEGRPFLLALWPSAPHAGKGPGVPNPVSPAPASRHADLHPGLRAPRGPAFLEADLSDKPPAVVATQAKVTRALEAQGISLEALEAIIDQTWQARARSLAAVDELVVAVVEALERTGELGQTLIVFTSDNGWLIGEHGLPFAKVVAYEESIRVPLLVRGPGFTPGTTPSQPVGHHDIVPTIVRATGITPGRPLDGVALHDLVGRPGARQHRALLLQSGPSDDSYTGVRVAGWSYVRWADGSVELYDLLRDPHQLDNRADDPAYAVTRQRLERTRTELEACSGTACLVEVPPRELR